MLSQTRRALEDFDNQHDFERMAADVLNALGYVAVESMAPGGGPDGGCDIQFREGDAPGLAFVTLEKKIKDKFKQDLAKHGDSEGVIALFCNVDVTPALKLAFTKDSIAKGYRLLVFDLERLRSLLDSSLKAIRRRYLHIDDEAAATLRSQVHKLLNYPDAVPAGPQLPTKLEQMLVNKLPCRLFDLLMQYDESMVGEVPGIGHTLKSHLKEYYGFRQATIRFESELMSRIAVVVGDRFASQVVWRMYFDYALPRFFGRSKEEIVQWGNSLNYGVTWDDTERVFALLSSETALNVQVAELDRMLTKLGQDLSAVSTG